MKLVVSAERSRCFGEERQEAFAQAVYRALGILMCGASEAKCMRIRLRRENKMHPARHLKRSSEKLVYRAFLRLCGLGVFCLFAVSVRLCSPDPLSLCHV